MTMVTPFSRLNFFSASSTSAFAPTSMPRVGSETNSSDGASANAFARHTFCVTALNHGVSLHVVSQLMGHASIQATEKTYAEFLDDTVTDEMSKLEKCFELKALE